MHSSGRVKSLPDGDGSSGRGPPPRAGWHHAPPRLRKKWDMQTRPACGGKRFGVWMRLLLTGSTGFVGRAVLEHLKEGSRDLRIVVRSPEARVRLAASGFVARAQDEVIEQDLTQRFALPRLLEGCSEVVHCAGRVSSRPHSRKQFYADTVGATAYLLEAALAAGVKRVVLVSPALAVGAGSGSEPVDESVRWDLSDLPGDYFQASRLRELEALRTASLGLPIVFATPTFCLGPGDVNGSSALILAPLSRRHPLVTWGGINVIDVRDAASGIVQALELGIPGQRYFLGGHDVTFLALGAAWQALLPYGHPPRSIPLPLFRAATALGARLSSDFSVDAARGALYGRYWFYSSQRSHEAFHTHTRPLQETLQATLGWYQAHPHQKIVPV